MSLLDNICAQLASPIGFLVLLKPETFVCWGQATQGATEAPRSALRDAWQDCAQRQQPVWGVVDTEAQAGLPAPDTPVRCELVVPVVRAGQTVALLGVARAAGDYSDGDAARLSSLAGMAYETVARRRAELDRDALTQQLARSERALDENQRRFSSIVATSRDGVLVLNPNGEVLYCNPSAERLFGTAEGTLVGMHLGFPLVDGDAAEIDIVRQGKGPGQAELRTQMTNWHGEPAFLAVVTDITERRQAEELQRRLIHADRLAAIGQMASGVAHEINNPLAYVLANLELGARHLSMLSSGLKGLRAELFGAFGTAGPQCLDAVFAENRLPSRLAELKEMSAENIGGAERIRDIVRDLRSFSRIERDEIELVNLNEVVHTACNIVYNEIRHRAALVKDLGQVPSVAADRGKLTQVITNLLVNAAHSIEEGAAEQNKIKVVTTCEGDWLLLVVEDTGCGMPAHVRRRIFEPFFTTKPRDQGTGLGLSMSAEIVRKHGGEIRVSSSAQGSQFEVRLPMDTGLAVSMTPIAPTVDPAQGRSRARVLVIDDEQVLLNVFRRSLGRANEVVIAEGGAEGLAVLEEDRHFDIILCDLMMPRVDGVMVYEKLRETAPELLPRIVFCTGGAFTARAKAFLASVDNVILEKPMNFALLRRLVAQFGDRGGPR